jgi:hypothetical protein
MKTQETLRNYSTASILEPSSQISKLDDGLNHLPRDSVIAKGKGKRKDH